MKFYFLWISFVLFTGIVFAQKNHTVGPKETFYSIGRDFQVHPRELAEYNKLDLSKGLSVGQVIKIPANKKMKPVEAAAPATTAKANPRTAIYHIVKKQENLFQVRMQYNKVPMDSLKKWNNLTSDNVKEGMKLIVGYTDNNPVVVKEIEEPAQVGTINIHTESTVQLPEPTVDTVQKNISSPVTAKIETTEQPSTTQTSGLDSSLNKDNSEGYFKSAYKGIGLQYDQAGMAAAFKSTSGWDDKRYYCLHNSIPAGTIVMITNKANQKVAYAKVLDAMPDLEANKDLLVRISKAMAEALGITGDKANVSVTY